MVFTPDRCTYIFSYADMPHTGRIAKVEGEKGEGEKETLSNELHKMGECEKHTIRSSGGLRSSISDSVVSQSTWYSFAISFMTFSFTSPDGVLTESLSISWKGKKES